MLQNTSYTPSQHQLDTFAFTLKAHTQQNNILRIFARTTGDNQIQLDSILLKVCAVFINNFHRFALNLLPVQSTCSSVCLLAVKIVECRIDEYWHGTNKLYTVKPNVTNEKLRLTLAKTSNCAIYCTMAAAL